eukprot:5537975-Amphidinium_carterae.1
MTCVVQGCDSGRHGVSTMSHVQVAAVRARACSEFSVADSADGAKSTASEEIGPPIWARESCPVDR